MANDSSATGSYSEGVKWILAIAAAGIAGAFLHVKEVEAQPIAVQVIVGLAVLAFSVSVCAGASLLLWFNSVALAHERLPINKARLEEEERRTTPDPEVSTRLKGRIDRAEKTIREAEDESLPRYHFLYVYGFGGGMLMATLAILLSLWLHHLGYSEKSPDTNSPMVALNLSGGDRVPVDAGRFTVVYSAVHATRKGREAHTFLLNQQTGELWKMVCAPGGEVRFQKVQRTELP